MIDREIGNWWTSTNRKSKFHRNIMASRAEPDGRRLGILNDRFTIRRGADVLQETAIEGPAHLLSLLSEHFGLEFPNGTEFRVVSD